ncbi:hypothetical protein NGRA_2990 [Nosema granulosis]|uniref:Telomeric single stranded DNA binding POT1/Cdc13 domain-containing protein n=1 Tax=Nosema granulosis TaxID=83296 RepID=A0A9P6GX28_9MICR|nr:hypothetical protein NGRA_2990 [Nosema granulosis]
MNTYPQRFEPLQPKRDLQTDDIYDGRSHDVVCRVQTVYDWTKSKGDDYVMTLSVSTINTDTEKKIFLKIFNETPLDLEIRSNDNISVKKIKHFAKDLFIVQHPLQIDFVKNVKFPKRNRICEIKDISTASRYVDIAGEIIHKQRESHNIAVLFMIDYTKNIRIIDKLNRGKYSNDMILHIKIWDDLCNSFNDIEIGKLYRFENLKVEIQNNIICGNLSNKKDSKIIRLKDDESRNILEKKEAYYKTTFKQEQEHEIYKKINTIDREGFFKVKFQVIRFFPKDCFCVEACKNCFHIYDSESKKCKCSKKRTTTMRILKLLVEDESGQLVMLCKNDISDIVLKKLNEDQKSFTCLISAIYKEGCFIFEVKEIFN